MPARSPFAPSATCSTSGGPGSEVKMTSHCSASAFGLSAQTAPAARCRSAAARRTSCTTSSKPAFWRLAAMLAPIVPSPIKPTFMCISRTESPSPLGRGWRARRTSRVRVSAMSSPAFGLHPPAPSPSGRGLLCLFLLEDVLGDECGGHRRRPAGIEREMGDHLAQLRLGNPVVDGAFKVADQLLLAAERYQGGDDDQATIALRQASPLPNIPEQHLLGVVDQRRDGVADGIARRGGLRLSHASLQYRWGDEIDGRTLAWRRRTATPAGRAGQTAEASASSRSRIKSSAVSRPIERRTTSRPAPAAARCSSDSCRCVVEAGCRIRLRVSPILARCENSRTFSTSLTPAS